MKIAHIREHSAPAGTPWRLAGALDPGEAPARWLDLEVARRRAARSDARLAHDAALYRSPLTTLDDHLARGLRVEALREPGDVVTLRIERLGELRNPIVPRPR